MRWAPGEWSELAGIPLPWLLMTSLPFASVRGNVNLFRNFGYQSTRDLIFAFYHNRHLAILKLPPPPLGWSVWESCAWVQGSLGTGDKLMGERRSERTCQLSSLLLTEWKVDSQEQAAGLTSNMCGVKAKGEPVDSIVNQGSDAAFDLNFLLEASLNFSFGFWHCQVHYMFHLKVTLKNAFYFTKVLFLCVSTYVWGYMCGYSARGVQKYHWSPGVRVRAVVNHPVCELGTILGSSASAVWTLNPWAISLAPLCLLTESRPSLLHYLGVALSRITPCISVSLSPLSSLPSLLPSCTPPSFFPLHSPFLWFWFG